MCCFLIVWYPCKSEDQGGEMSLHIQLLILINVDSTQETLRSFEYFFFLFFWLFLIKSSFVFLLFHLLHFYVCCCQSSFVFSETGMG